MEEQAENADDDDAADAEVKSPKATATSSAGAISIVLNVIAYAARGPFHVQ